VVYPTHRVEFYEESSSCNQLRENLDFLEECRAEAYLRALAYKKAVARLYDRMVHPQRVQTGNLVLRKAEVSDPTRSRGKLATN
ncbi:hypothetical protein BHE74_00030956, partial [Ensete ventricosum]